MAIARAAKQGKLSAQISVNAPTPAAAMATSDGPTDIPTVAEVYVPLNPGPRKVRRSPQRKGRHNPYEIPRPQRADKLLAAKAHLQ